MTPDSRYTLGLCLPREDVEESDIDLVTLTIRRAIPQFYAKAGFRPQRLRIGTVLHAHLCREMQRAMNVPVKRINALLDMQVIEDEDYDRNDRMLLSGDSL